MNASASLTHSEDKQAELYRLARRHVQRRIGFLTHLSVYVAVNLVLVLANLLWLPRMPIAAAPLLGWGIGLLFHGLAVYLHAPGATWKRRMIEKEIKRLSA